MRNHVLEQVDGIGGSERQRKAKYLTAYRRQWSTGVELAGMLADMQRDILYRTIPK